MTTQTTRLVIFPEGHPTIEVDEEMIRDFIRSSSRNRAFKKQVENALNRLSKGKQSYV